MSDSPCVEFILSNRAISEVTGWPIDFRLADGNVITGQQQHSGAEAARLAIGLVA